MITTHTPMSKHKDDHALIVRIPLDWHEDLRTRSFKERRPVSELIREALMDHFGYVKPEKDEEGRKGGLLYPFGGTPGTVFADAQR